MHSVRMHSLMSNDAIGLFLAAPDPEFGFEKKLEKKKAGKTKRKLKLKCKTDNPEAKVKWYKDGKEIKKSDPRFLMKNENGEQSLEIRSGWVPETGKIDPILWRFILSQCLFYDQLYYFFHQGGPVGGQRQVHL